jgi:hypothetical protein
MCYNRLQYLLKFKGYDESHNQWEVHTQVHAKPKIALFHRKYPGAARYINAAIFDSIPFTRADLATSWRSSCVVTPHFEGGSCKGTSVLFLTSPILSHSLPVHMYYPSSPLYYLQGPYP